jgi:hypothetical protein
MPETEIETIRIYVLVFLRFTRILEMYSGTGAVGGKGRPGEGEQNRPRSAARCGNSTKLKRL